LYSGPSIIMKKNKDMRWARQEACMREMRNAKKILVGNPEGKRPLRKYRR